METFIIVTGIPASGKSTIAQSVSQALKLPILDKDEILESLFQLEGIGDAEWRTRLSRAADKALRAQAQRSDGAVIASWWRHPESLVDTGTPSDWLSALPGIVIEIYCACSPEVAAERFLARTRHEGHLDRLQTHAELLASFQEHAALWQKHRGLGLFERSRVLEVDTEQVPALKRLLAQINLVLGQGVPRANDRL